MSDPATLDRDAPVQPVRLLGLVLGGAVIWAVRFAAGYALVPAACDTGTFVLHVVTIVATLAVAMVIAATVRRVRASDDPARTFLLLFGLALHVFFLGAILLEGVSVVAVDPCAKGAVS